MSSLVVSSSAVAAVTTVESIRKAILGKAIPLIPWRKVILKEHHSFSVQVKEAAVTTTTSSY